MGRRSINRLRRSDRCSGCRIDSKKPCSGGNQSGHGHTSSSGPVYVGTRIPPRISLIPLVTAFKPKLLLLLPSATLLLILLHIHERTNPLPSLLGVALGPTPMGTARITANAAQGGSASSPVASSSGAFTSSTGVDGEVIPVVPPKEAESSVDFFMNMQAIQNLMGLM